MPHIFKVKNSFSGVKKIDIKMLKLATSSFFDPKSHLFFYFNPNQSIIYWDDWNECIIWLWFWPLNLTARTDTDRGDMQFCAWNEVKVRLHFHSFVSENFWENLGIGSGRCRLLLRFNQEKQRMWKSKPRVKYLNTIVEFLMCVVDHELKCDAQNLPLG